MYQSVDQDDGQPLVSPLDHTVLSVLIMILCYYDVLYLFVSLVYANGKVCLPH